MALDADTEIRKIKFATNSSGDLGISVPDTINGGTINLSLLRSDNFKKCRDNAKDAIRFSTTSAGEIKFKIPNNLDDTYDNEISIKSERVGDDPDDYGLALTEHGSDFHSTSLNPDSDDENYSETDTIEISSDNGDFKFTKLKGRTDGGNDLDYQDYLKNGKTQYWDGRYPPKIVNSGQEIQFFDADGDDDEDDVNAKITITGKDIKIIEEASVTKLIVQKKGDGQKEINSISDGTEKTTSFSIDGTQKTFHKITWEGHDTNNATIDDDGSATRRVLFVDSCNSVEGKVDEDCVLSITSITGVTLVPSDDDDTEPPTPPPSPGEPTVSLSASPQDILKNGTSTITFDFSESVNFFIQDIKVSKGTLSDFDPEAGNFTTSTTATLTPDTDYLGLVNVTVPAESFTSEADGILNSTSYTIKIKVTEQPPTPSITITPEPNRLESAGDTSTISINLSQDSTDFTSDDVYLDPNVGALSNFTGSGDRYTVTYTPAAAQETDVNVKVDSGSFTNSAGLEGSAASAAIYVSNTPAPVTVYDGPSECDDFGPWTPSNYNPNAACADTPSTDNGGDKDLIFTKTGDHTVELDLKHFQGKLVTVDVSWSRDAAWENDFSFEVAKCSDIKEGGSFLSFTPYTSQTISKDNPEGPLNWRIYNIDGGSKVKFTSTSTPNAAPTRPILEYQVSDPVVVTDETTGLVTTTYTQSCVQIGTDTASPWPPCPEEVYVTKTGYNEVKYVYSDGAKDGANDQFITVTLKATRSVLPSNRKISMDLGLQKHIWLASTTADDGNGEPGHSLYDYHNHSDLVRFRNPSTGSSKTDLKTGGTQFSELVGYAGAKTPSEVDAAISSADGEIADLSS